MNEYFSSVFTTEDISSHPVPITKFEGDISEHLGQIFVTPEMIAKKIKKVKDNKSTGVDGTPPKLLKEILEQISISFAKVFNLSLEEGIVLSEKKEANITLLFENGPRNKPEKTQTSEFNISCMYITRNINYRPHDEIPFKT